jgi:hypothetical protein
LDFATVIVLQSKVFSLASNPHPVVPVTVFMFPGDRVGQLCSQPQDYLLSLSVIRRFVYCQREMPKIDERVGIQKRVFLAYMKLPENILI